MGTCFAALRAMASLLARNGLSALVLAAALFACTSAGEGSLQPMPQEPPGAPAAPAGETSGWPRTLSNNEQITVYQPDVESWTGNQIIERAAVSILTRASSEPSYGVIWITARTEV